MQYYIECIMKRIFVWNKQQQQKEKQTKEEKFTHKSRVRLQLIIDDVSVVSLTFTYVKQQTLISIRNYGRRIDIIDAILINPR